MNHHTPERHLVVLETTFQDQCEVKIKIKNQKRGKVRRHECLLHFSWIYTHPHTSTYSPLFQPVWCDRINQLASWGGKCGETPPTAGLLCCILYSGCIVYIVYCRPAYFCTSSSAAICLYIPLHFCKMQFQHQCHYFYDGVHHSDLFAFLRRIP